MTKKKNNKKVNQIYNKKIQKEPKIKISKQTPIA